MNPVRSLPAVALVLCLLPPLGVSEPPNPARPLGRVYLIRGQGWVFSNGWRALRDRLREAGVRAEDVSDLSGGWTTEEIVADHRAGRLNEPIVFVGHSRGGRQSLFAAQRLEREGVAVDLLVTTDVAIPPRVPANVRRAVNLYLVGPRLYPARPLKAAPGCEAAIENIALDAAGSPIDAEGLDHLNITDRPAVRDYLFRLILDALRQREPHSKIASRS